VTAAVRSGRLAGAAFDVYDPEPPPDLSFTHDDRILATPHLGASTEAAQLAVSTQAVAQMIEALLHGHYLNAVNIVAISPEEMERIRPLCDLAEKLGRMAGGLNRGRPRGIQVTCKGEVAEQTFEPIVHYGVMGVLQTMLGDSVNIVSAPHLAEERGIQVTGSATHTQEAGFTDMIVLALSTDAGDMEVAGTVFGKRHPRIMRIGGFYTEVLPDGHLLMVFGKDKPGLIGTVGEALARAGINIARMTFGRQEAGGDALLALNLDEPCDEAALERIRHLSLVDKAVQLSL